MLFFWRDVETIDGIDRGDDVVCERATKECVKENDKIIGSE